MLKDFFFCFALYSLLGDPGRSALLSSSLDVLSWKAPDHGLFLSPRSLRMCVQEINFVAGTECFRDDAQALCELMTKLGERNEEWEAKVTRAVAVKGPVKEE